MTPDGDWGRNWGGGIVGEGEGRKRGYLPIITQTQIGSKKGFITAAMEFPYRPGK